MYPAIDLPGGLPPAYDKLVDPSRPLLMPPQDVAMRRKAWVDEWLQAVSQ
jgi:thiamine transport system substrate-binding protein